MNITFIKLYQRFEKRKESLNKWFVKKGVHLELTDNSEQWININSNIAKNEPHLIYIGHSTTIGGGVEFVTHDNCISKVIEGKSDLFGKIVIGRNCFIGARSVILYGVTLADNVIVAAGSVVTKSFHESNIIIGGNPARIITDWNNFKEKTQDYAWNCNEYSSEELIMLHNKGERLIKK